MAPRSKGLGLRIGVRGIGVYVGCRRWRQLEEWRLEQYRLHARLSGHQRLVQKALNLIEEALTLERTWYVSWSGGKDSNALLHLVRRVKPDIPICHVDTDLDYPDCRQQVSRWIGEWGIAEQTTVLRPEVSPWEIIDRHGGPESQVNNASSELDRKCFFEPIEQYVQENGYTGVFMGLRADESYGRRMNRKMRGAIYETLDGLMRCNPLSDWKTPDVWAYTLANDIPWLPVYDKSRGHPNPERIREGWYPIGGFQVSQGGLVWLRANYPELYQDLKRRYPHYAAGV